MTLGVRSLHKRLLLGLAIGWVVVVAAILVSTWNSGQLLIREVSDEHLEYEASILAEEIEQGIQLRFEALQRLAIQLKALQSYDPTELTTELQHNDALLALFDGLMIVGREGKVQADWPVVAGRQGLDISETESFRFQREVSRPYVSDPFLGRASLTYLVMISVPFVDGEGRFAGMLAGVTSVLRGSLFEKLRRIRIGDHGFATVMTASGTMLVHPDRGLVLRPTPTQAKNPWLDLALSGWEGTASGHLINGEMALQAYQQVWPASWVVGVMMPQQQAFSPLQWFVRHLWMVGTVTVVVMLALLWWLLRLALLSLRQFERQIEAVGQGRRDCIELLTATTELSHVAATFNRVVQKQRRAEGELLDRQAFLDAVLASSPVGMFVYDLEGNLRYVNPAMIQRTGHDLDWYQRQGARGFAACVHPDDRNDVIDLWRYTLKSGRDFQRQFRYITSRGDTIWVESHASLVRLGNGQPLGFVGTLKDITQRREMEALQRWEAEHDPLTGLLNRRGFERRMEDALAEWLKSGSSSALVMFDLDHFKPINDDGGHALGDEMLQRIAEAASAQVRKSDHVARHGGDEFALLMPGCDLTQAEVIAQALRRAVEALSVERDGKIYRVSLSLGVTMFREGDRDIDMPMQRADQASYRAKAAGRNRTVIT